MNNIHCKASVSKLTQDFNQILQVWNLTEGARAAAFESALVMFYTLLYIANSINKYNNAGLDCT